MFTVFLVILVGLGTVQDRREVARPTTEETVAAFRSTAQQIESLQYNEVLYGRLASGHWAAELQPLSQLLGRRDPVESVSPLLRDADAKVRTLALLALYDREDPKLLPQMAALSTDEAASFPEPTPVAVRLPAAETPPVTPRTVGWCARSLVEFYMRQAGFESGIRGAGDKPGFDAYWSARKDRSCCASWLLVRQQRAFGGTSPFQKDRSGALSTVRGEVNRLPATERALMVLWLPDVEGQFSTEAERIEAARSLGREKLLALLRREVPSEDPDLRPGADTMFERFPCSGIVRFVLEHANALLRPEDSGVLLDLGAAERIRNDERSFPAMNTAWWEIAAANLEPAKAKEIIEGAHMRIATLHYPEAAKERADLLEAHWSLCASAGDDWLAEHFYSETLEGDFMPPARRDFLQALGRDGSVRARATLARLVRDPGFAGLDAGTLRELGQVVNDWTKPPIFGERELWDLSHPLGESSLRAQKQIEAAARQYPDATRAFLAKLDGWRARITKSLPDWAPPAPK